MYRNFQPRGISGHAKGNCEYAKMNGASLEPKEMMFN